MAKTTKKSKSAPPDMFTTTSMEDIITTPYHPSESASSYDLTKPFLKKFIIGRGLEIRKDYFTGRDLVDVDSLDLEFRRYQNQKQTREFERKSSVEEVLTDIVDKAINQFEDGL